MDGRGFVLLSVNGKVDLSDALKQYQWVTLVFDAAECINLLNFGLYRQTATSLDKGVECLEVVREDFALLGVLISVLIPYSYFNLDCIWVEV